jgi:hypothetical protein
MGLRFRKSVKLAPGIRMNVSGSGISWTLGPRGASVGIGKRGTHLNSGIPGTGLYSRERIGGSGANRRDDGSYTKMSITVEVTDEGTISFRDAEGNVLPERIVNAAKKQHGDTIRDLINKKCDEINSQIDALGEIHLYTPNSNVKPQFQPQEFPEPSPVKPIPKKPGLLGMLFKAKLRKIEKENQERDHQYQNALAAWQAEKQKFENAERNRKDIIERAIYSDVDAMQMFIEENLLAIVWPRETTISTEIVEGGRNVFVDVDLPEIEDMPRKIASAPQRGYKLSVKDMPVTKVQNLYMRHVHGIGFRIIGEVFSALPNTQ